MKKFLLSTLLIFPLHAKADWIEYSTAPNGDVYFFDEARVQKKEHLIQVWNRVRYKNSVMGASSYQSLIEIDCAAYSETTLQSTFYTDEKWTVPAMSTDTNRKPTESINLNTASHRLAAILCK